MHVSTLPAQTPGLRRLHRGRHWLLFFIRLRGFFSLAGNKLETRFAVGSDRVFEFDASLGNQFGKLQKVGRNKLEATVRKVDVHYATRTNRHCPKIFRTGKKCLIVQ